MDFVAGWVAAKSAAESHQETEEPAWRAVVAVMVLAASLGAVLAPAAIAVAAMFGWLG